MHPEAEPECRHGCCSACCVACLGSDELQERNCYCGHPLCWFGRSRLRGKGGGRAVGSYEREIACVDEAGHAAAHRAYMVRVIAGKKHRELATGWFTFGERTGVALFASGVRVFVHALCNTCIGEVVHEWRVS